MNCFNAQLFRLRFDLEKQKELYHKAIKERKSFEEVNILSKNVKHLERLADIFLQEVVS